MTHYSENESSVRVDVFKQSGKWYTTISVVWLHYEGDIHGIFGLSVRQQCGDRFSGMTLVCLAPHHEHEHPLMIREYLP